MIFLSYTLNKHTNVHPNMPWQNRVCNNCGNYVKARVCCPLYSLRASRVHFRVHTKTPNRVRPICKPLFDIIETTSEQSHITYVLIQLALSATKQHQPNGRSKPNDNAGDEHLKENEFEFTSFPPTCRTCAIVTIAWHTL